MAGRGNTSSIVWKIAQPIAEELGLTLWDVRFLKEGSNWYLRIFIDKPGGVSLDDCEAMSRAVDAPLDERDPIEQPYYLEVCSPGVERELTRPEHFEAMVGRRVLLRLIRPVSGQKELGGELLGYENGVVRLRAEDGGEISVQKKEASSVHLVDEEEINGGSEE